MEGRRENTFGGVSYPQLVSCTCSDLELRVCGKVEVMKSWTPHHRHAYNLYVAPSEGFRSPAALRPALAGDSIPWRPSGGPDPGVPGQPVFSFIFTHFFTVRKSMVMANGSECSQPLWVLVAGLEVCRLDA